MSARACKNCAFFFPHNTIAFPTPDGQCRRYAPQGPTTGTEGNGWQAFPPMTSWHWCGDYRRGHQEIAAQAAEVAA